MKQVVKLRDKWHASLLTLDPDGLQVLPQEFMIYLARAFAHEAVGSLEIYRRLEKRFSANGTEIAIAGLQQVNDVGHDAAAMKPLGLEVPFGLHVFSNTATL